MFALIMGLAFSFSAVTFAQDEVGTTTEEVEVDEITAEDLGVENPGILPTNPFYFFKEFSRGVQRFFKFDEVGRAEFELKVLNEKAAEMEIVEEMDPSNSDALETAVENYNEHVSRLRIRLEALSETSENPNVDRLLDQLTDRALSHQQLFDELHEKHVELRVRIETTQDDLDEAVRPVFDRIGTCEEFKERMERIATEGDGSPEAILRALRLIDRLEDHADNSGHGNCLGELEDRLVNLLEEMLGDDVDIDDLIDRLPGGDKIRLRIVDEIRDGVDARSRFRLRLDDFRLDILERIGDGDVGAEDANDMIVDAEERINKLKDRIASGKYEVPVSAERLLSEAEELLRKARAMLENGRYGETFGEANMARRVAGAGLSQLVEIGGEDRGDHDDDHESEDDHTDDRSGRRDGGSGFIDIRGGDVIACIELYNPVCGKNGVTYSNECFAKVAGADVDYEGVCGANDSDNDVDDNDHEDDSNEVDAL